MCFVGITSTTHATATVTACPQPTCAYLPFVAIAQPIEVTGYVVALFGGGNQPTYYAVRGQVINRSNEPIYDARVRVSGVDGFGNFVSQTVQLALPVTFSGQLNPFEAVYPRDGGNVPRPPQLEIIGGSTADADGYQPVTVVTSRTVSNGGIEVTFRNDGLMPVTDVQAVVGVIYPNSQTILYPRVYPPYSVASFIGPNSTVTYTFPMVLLGGGSQKWWFVAAQGITCIPAPFCP
jgi:hypothetical protein